MPRRDETLRLTPGALSEALTAAGLSLAEFCHLFDLNYDTAKRWTKHPDHPRACEPPYWITPILEQCTDPGFLYDVRCARLANTANPQEREFVHAD